MGEASLGLVDGVISTLPGFLDGKEVVKVDYNPEVVSLETLKERAKTAKCSYREPGDGKEADTVKPDKEPKYYLSKTLLRFVPMTALQATRINGMLNQPAHRDLLSPRQLELLEYIEAHPDKGWKNMIGQEITSAWNRADQIRKQAK